MSANQQRWMGGIILLGGSALLASFLFQGNGQKGAPTQQVAPVDKTLNLDPIHRLKAPDRPVDGADNSAISNQSVSGNTTGDQPVQLTPLAVDVDTERKLLAAQHEMREKNVAEQEARTAEFLARQQQAEANSARRVAAEQAARLEARRAKDAALSSSTDPAMPDANIAAGDDPVQTAALKRRQADQDQAEQSKLRVQKLDAVNESAKDTLAQAVARTAKAKAEREAAQKAQIQADNERHLQAAKERQEKLAKEKQAKHDAEVAQRELEAKQKKEKLAQEKQAKLDAAAAKLSEEKAAKLKILQAEKAERAKLRGDTSAASDDKKAALQAEVEKNKKEAAILQAKLDKLNAASKGKSATQDTQKAKDTARARALLNDDDDKPTPAAAPVAAHTLVMVQVAMAESQAKADAMVAQLRAKGYKVRTSSTNKGVRVLVGPEKDAAAASAIKHKIEQDGSLNVKGAWVSNWQPPTS